MSQLTSLAKSGWQERLGQWVPLWGLRHTYQREWLAGDLIAGIIVAIMLIPQGMAYALLAGLPPQAGLYASMLPLVLYGIFGSSRYLAVGPTAIVSLLTASGIGAVASNGGADYWQLALTLALLIGIIQTGMGLLRVGFLVNFLSHPVLVGFSGAAAIVIGFSQVKSLLGFAVPNTAYFYEQVWYVLTHLGETNGVTLGLGIAGILILLYFKYLLKDQLARWGISETWRTSLTKIAPLLIVVVGTILVWGFGWHETVGVDVVGEVPAGLPPITLPSFQLATWQMLLPTALAISFVSYMESISVAKSLASKRRQKISPNQELVALGLANLGATFTGGHPVTGGFSRSLVNFSAGAETTIASLITAVLIVISVLLFTPLFYFIPKTMLAAIIIISVVGLVDVGTFQRVWRYNKRDAFALIITFLAVLVLGIETGILVGAVASLVMFIARTSNPHVAVVGRLNNSEIYRNVLRHRVQTWDEVALVRIDASLYFANTKILETTITDIVADNPKLKELVLIGTAINDIDFSALESLEMIWQELRDAGISLHLAAIKGPVYDRLKSCGFVEHIGVDQIHLTTHDAMQSLGYV